MGGSLGEWFWERGSRRFVPVDVVGQVSREIYVTCLGFLRLFICLMLERKIERLFYGVAQRIKLFRFSKKNSYSYFDE